MAISNSVTSGNGGISNRVTSGNGRISNSFTSGNSGYRDSVTSCNFGISVESGNCGIGKSVPNGGIGDSVTNRNGGIDNSVTSGNGGIGNSVNIVNGGISNCVTSGNVSTSNSATSGNGGIRGLIFILLIKTELTLSLLQRQVSHLTLHLSFWGHQLSQLSWCVTVVVVSDDPAFLAAFAQWSLKGQLLGWSTRLLAVTRLPLRRLQDLHGTFSMTNSMMLIVYDSHMSTSCSVYIHLPYSPWGTQPLHVAYWTPRKGIVLTTRHQLFPEKLTKLLYGPKFVLAAEEFEPHTLLVRDPSQQAAGEGEALFYGPMVNLLHMLADDMNFTSPSIKEIIV
ncbi:uncharacterized protein [Panulirus ornatus]|uniref:uncharacterized protein n=1 Tax=Panulirus ornatus TaxID=150431 RepID=UPI003A8C7416